jgi:hypothetical protein
METYIAKWYSRDTGTTTDITSRCGGVSTADDLDSLAVTMSMDVQQSSIDPYHKPLAIACGDRILFYKDGSLVMDGQIETISGDYRTKMQLSVTDDGIILTQNDFIIQFNSVAADTAIKQLCAKLGIAVGSVPAMSTKITKIYHGAVSTILQDILDTATAETGTEYKIRVRGGKLYITPYGTAPVTATYQPAGSLPAFPIQRQPGAPSVKWSIDSLRNAVQIYSDQDNSVSVLASASDAASIARYGQRMKLDTFSDSDGATAAQKARTLLSQLNTVSEEISIHTYGAGSVTAGVVLAFDLAEFTGTFLVKAVTHNYDHPHTMDLTLKRI